MGREERRNQEERSKAGNGIELRRVTFQVPICTVCKTHVDKFEKVDGSGSKSGLVKLVAYCHGDISESPWLDPRYYDNFYTYRAFMDPRRRMVKGREIKTDIDATGGFKWIK